MKKMDAELIGRASVLLGGGRQKPGAAIDFAVGLSNIKKVDERIERGDRFCSFMRAMMQLSARSCRY